MPINISNLNEHLETSDVKLYSPKFFDKKLTGTGGKIGVLKELKNPIYTPTGTPTIDENINTRKRKTINGDTETTYIPLNPLTANAWCNMDKVKVFDTNKLTVIGERKSDNMELSIHVLAHSLVLEETSSPFGGKSRKLTPCYQIFWYFNRNKNNDEYFLYNSIFDAIYMQSSTTNTAYTSFSCNPMETINNINGELATVHNVSIDAPAVIQLFDTYSLYEAVVERAFEWNETIDKIYDYYFETIAASCAGRPTTDVYNMLRRLEIYNVPLDLYRNIYNSIKTHFKVGDDATQLCKQNLNLLLSDTLYNLDKNKSLLTHVPTPKTPVTTSFLSKFSQEQLKAVTSNEPLVLVQAGAGTGKSFTILGRIDYMVASGIAPQDITVLSFTNAAADHIKDMNPDIHSMTIASMIHSIYELNFPTHELSNLDTVINSIDIYYPNDNIAYEFRKRLFKIKKNERDSFTSMNNFIEANYDAVISMLNTLGQTSLELEIIICYQQIDNFKEPAEVASKYLIVDEVQDNSIFEFIYTLKYVDKHKESLFIVGDCAQTLYEFRASNPKALNVLEGSGVFATYQLQVNYRSNQEILDFANVALQNIEANQYANIQLRANSLKPVTEQSFTDSVKLVYKKLKKLSEFNEQIGGILNIEAKSWIEDKINAGEKVAVLAYTRKSIDAAKDALTTIFPNKSIVSIVPDKMHNSVIFSEFIKRYWDEVKFIPTQNLTVTISQCIISKLKDITGSTKNAQKALPFAQKLVSQWTDSEDGNIRSWTKQYLNKQITFDQLMEFTKNSMLQFEIKHNAIKQALLSARNAEDKKSQNVDNADIILSTIHSAKGLEFDNVIVLYQNSNYIDEEKKRMYYVAFTRAMKSEIIIAYDTSQSPQIVADYETILDTLNPARKKAKKSKKIKV